MGKHAEELSSRLEKIKTGLAKEEYALALSVIEEIQKIENNKTQESPVEKKLIEIAKNHITELEKAAAEKESGSGAAGGSVEEITAHNSTGDDGHTKPAGLLGIVDGSGFGDS